MNQETTHIIDRIRSGDEDSLREIYREYRQPFIQWIKGEFSCTDDDAIEFFQTSVVILYDNIITGKLTELNSHVKTYLFGIGRNKAREWLRHRQRQGTTADDLLINYLHEEAPETDEAEFAASLRTIDAGMNQLGEPCRSLLTYFYYQKLSMREICERLEYKNEDTAKNQKYKCLKRLQSICLDIQGVKV